MKESNETVEITVPPGTDAYLQTAIQRAVVAAGIKHPATVYPLSLGICAGVVGALFEFPFLMIFALFSGLFGPIWAIWQIFFRHQVLGSQYLESLHIKQKQYEKYLIRQIQSGLKSCAEHKALNPFAKRGVAHLSSVQAKLANVKELLGMKLTPNEITYGRFLGAAEQVSLSVLDNLNMVVSVLKSATSIDPEYIQTRLKAIEAKQKMSKEDEEQRKSLQQRWQLWNHQLRKVEKFMAQNESAMTEMERISAAVAEWRTGRKFAAGDFESAIKQLQDLAEQAHAYKELA